jgi:hypothetical protein
VQLADDPAQVPRGLRDVNRNSRNKHRLGC